MNFDLKKVKLILENDLKNNIDYESIVNKAKDLNTPQNELEEISRTRIHPEIHNALINNPNSGFNVLHHIVLREPKYAGKVANHPLVQLDFLENPELINTNNPNIRSALHYIAQDPETPESMQNMLASSKNFHYSLSKNQNLNPELANNLFQFHKNNLETKPHNENSKEQFTPWDHINNILKNNKNLPTEIIDTITKDLESGNLKSPYYNLFNNKNLSPIFLRNNTETILNMYPEYRKNKNTFPLRKALDLLIKHPNLGLKAKQAIRQAFGTENGPKLSDMNHEEDPHQTLES